MNAPTPYNIWLRKWLGIFLWFWFITGKNKLWKEVADWFIERFIYQEGNEWIVWFDLLITLYSKTTPTCKYFNIIRTWQYNPRPIC